MSRIIFVPQYPTPMRYQEWWYDEIPFKLRNAGFEVIVLGDRWVKQFSKVQSDQKMFSPVDTAISFETEQIKEYMNMRAFIPTPSQFHHRRWWMEGEPGVSTRALDQ